MNKLTQGPFIIAIFLLGMFAVPALAVAQMTGASLVGANEVPSISTRGNGVFAAQISADGTSLQFVLLYSDLEGGAVTGAHIHLGQPGVAGAIVIHFCGTGGKPACPASPGMVSGAVTASDVVAASAQGFAAGELAEVIRAIPQGVAYVNVHTVDFPTGEIRGQLR